MQCMCTGLYFITLTQSVVCFSASHVHILMILHVNHHKSLLSRLFMLCVGYIPSDRGPLATTLCT